MKLTSRQEAFCEYYIAHPNATEAAIKAGYSEKTAYCIGSENLRKPEIKKYIEEHAVQARNKRIADANEVLEYLTETMRSEEETRRERTKAAELLGKRYALFIEQASSAPDEKVSVNIVLSDCGGKDDS